MFSGSSQFGRMKHLMPYCESQLDIPKCVIVIDGKHVPIICPKRALMNFISVRRATVRCIVAAVDKSQISLYSSYNKRTIE